ncbi:MAG TPA: VOC family protein [Gammaproteobacteria bacterium]|jgi:catechol 2,3-dioxygenase-like lactoylglutathione lyase family enzyme|nr:VOC family protein [Gammaproteobacteria bacterium]
MTIPPPTAGLRHVALYVKNIEACTAFYTTVLQMKIIWQPDPDNIYLTSGQDNLALHRAPTDFTPGQHQRLDHIGFFLTHREEVDQWHDYLKNQGVEIKAPPKDHRDGTRSCYCADPDGNVIQFIFVP